MRRTFVIAVAVAIAFFTLQAAYWPLVVSPATKLHFWQMHWAAEIGYRVGAPAVGAILFAPLNGAMHEFVAVGLSLSWAAAVAWVASIGIHNFDQPPKKPVAAAPVNAAASAPAAPPSAAQSPAPGDQGRTRR